MHGVQGAMTNMDLKLEQDHEASAARLATLENNLDGLKELLTEALAKPLQKHRHGKLLIEHCMVSRSLILL